MDQLRADLNATLDQDNLEDDEMNMNNDRIYLQPQSAALVRMIRGRARPHGHLRLHAQYYEDEDEDGSSEGEEESRDSFLVE